MSHFGFSLQLSTFFTSESPHTIVLCLACAALFDFCAKVLSWLLDFLSWSFEFLAVVFFLFVSFADKVVSGLFLAGTLF